MLAGKLGRIAQRTTIDIAGNPFHMIGILVAPRCCHLQQNSEPPRHHEVTGRCGCEYETPAALRLLVGKLLGDCTSPGKAQHVDLLMSQLVEQPCAQACQCRCAIWQPWRRRTAYAWHVKDDCGLPVERVEKRFDQFDIGANPVEQEQRRPRLVAAPDANAKRLPVNIVQADLHLTSPERNAPAPLQAADSLCCQVHLAQISSRPSGPLSIRASVATSCRLAWPLARARLASPSSSTRWSKNKLSG